MKKRQILLLLITFMGNLTSMQIEDEKDKTLICLSNEINNNIINQVIEDTFIQAFLKELNNWRDILEESPRPNLSFKMDNSYKKNEVEKLSTISLSYIIKNNLTSIEIDNNLLELFNNLKNRRFEQLLFSLKSKALRKYRGISKEELNNKLADLLNQISNPSNSKEKLKKGVKKILKLMFAGADINTKNICGNTALIWAAIKGYEKLIEILLTYKANVNAKDNYGINALIWAAIKCNKNIAKMLIDAKADVDTKDNISHMTALMWAAKDGHKEIVERLIDAGANINTKNIYAKTALDYASEKGYEDIVKILKQRTEMLLNK